MNSSVKSSVSFIVLALNESRLVEDTVETIRLAVAGADIKDYQVVLVNDGSTDDTAWIMNNLASKDEKIIAVHNEFNLGPGGAYKRGVNAAKCEYVMVIAGDNAASSESIRMTINNLGKADIIISYCANPEIRSFTRRFGSQCFTTFINFLFGFRIPYYNGAVVLKDQLSDITLFSNGYAFFAEMVVKLLKRGSTYTCVGVYHQTIANASSSALKLKTLIRVLKDTSQIVIDVYFRRSHNLHCQQD